jgi:hypothetical protein
MKIRGIRAADLQIRRFLVGETLPVRGLKKVGRNGPTLVP